LYPPLSDYISNQSITKTAAYCRHSWPLTLPTHSFSHTITNRAQYHSMHVISCHYSIHPSSPPMVRQRPANHASNSNHNIVPVKCLTCTLCRRHIVTRQPGRDASRAAHATSTCSACMMGSEMVGTRYQEHRGVVTPGMWYPCRLSTQKIILQCPTVASICRPACNETPSLPPVIVSQQNGTYTHPLSGIVSNRLT
jgi:hypothetical protein